MLKEEVVAAVKEGKFHIYPVSTIDQGIEVLAGVKAGKRRKNGRFEPDSINDRVQKRLISLAEKLRAFTKGEEREEKAKGNSNGGNRNK
jgi:predicted ATP-dependent protease